MIKLLEPFENITRRLSGSSYPTLNLVHPYMCTLKRMFAPKNNETIDTYLDLIYGPRVSKDIEDNNPEDDNSENSSSNSDDDDFPTAGNQQHWQYSSKQFREQMRSQGQGRGWGRERGRG